MTAQPRVSDIENRCPEMAGTLLRAESGIQTGCRRTQRRRERKVGAGFGTLTCFGCFSLELPQNRHPERSALQIDRMTQRLMRGVEGPRRCLSAYTVRAFSTTDARGQDLPAPCKRLNSSCSRPQKNIIARPPGAGFGGRKASSGIGR
jgi:hypothetical protein